MAHSTHLEVERKYDVGPDAEVPELAGIAGIEHMGPAQEHHLIADYFDTEALDLARLGISLRRRRGGDDAGWHLKVPANGAGRTEVRSPLGAEDDSIPAELVVLVRGATRGRPLVLAAHLLTHRTQWPLVDSTGHSLAVLCDDRVVARRQAGQEVVRWREWEVELAEGADARGGLLDPVEELLADLGVQPAASRSKVRRALEVDGSPEPTGGAPATAGQVLTAYVARFRDRILTTEAGVRGGSPEALHHMRTATRRLRSVLATYRSLFSDQAMLEHTRSELQWLGRELGRPRDAHVLRSRLDRALAAEPPDLVLGQVRTRIDDELAADYRAGLATAMGALDSERFLSLIGALDDLAARSSQGPAADEPATDALPRLIAREVRRVRRARRAVPTRDDPGFDAGFHDLRKKAKRLRYAAESGRAVLGSPAHTLGKRAQRVQETLGVRQDAVVARHRLRELGVQAHLSGENGFTFGRLHALEETRARDAELAFERAWARLPTNHPRRRLSAGRS